MRRPALIIVIAVALLAIGVAVGAATTARFSDVTEDHWAISYMEWTDDAGIITVNEDGQFRPSEKVSRAQLASYFYKHDLYHQRTVHEDDLTIAESARFFDIFGAEWSDGTWYETTDSFDEAYTYDEVADLVADLCSELGDTPANASMREIREVIPNWLETVEWEQGATDGDKWRVVYYGYLALCSDYESIYSSWANADWPPLVFG